MKFRAAKRGLAFRGEHSGTQTHRVGHYRGVVNFLLFYNYCIGLFLLIRGAGGGAKRGVYVSERWIGVGEYDREPYLRFVL